MGILKGCAKLVGSAALVAAGAQTAARVGAEKRQEYERKDREIT